MPRNEGDKLKFGGSKSGRKQGVYWKQSDKRKAVFFIQPDWRRKEESGTKAFENYVHPFSVTMGRDKVNLR